MEESERDKDRNEDNRRDGFVPVCFVLFRGSCRLAEVKDDPRIHTKHRKGIEEKKARWRQRLNAYS
jgi:hypothetical protein